MKIIKILMISALTSFVFQPVFALGYSGNASYTSPYYSSDSSGFPTYYNYSNRGYSNRSYSNYGYSNYPKKRFFRSYRSYRSRLFERYSYRPVPKNGPQHNKGTFVFDPRNLNWAAYNSDGRLVRAGRASGGSNWCPDIGRSCHTPIGAFSVYSKGSAACKSSKYPLPAGGAPMPYCMFFNSNYSIHGSYEVPGYNASHGCIRVTNEAARWLNEDFIQHGTRVIVKTY